MQLYSCEKEKCIKCLQLTHDWKTSIPEVLLAFWQKSIPVHHNHARGAGVLLLSCAIVYFLSYICYNMLSCLLGTYKVRI